MKSAKFSIENDDIFSLENLPMIDALLETGLTLFVDKIFKEYNDMTLIQFAIAKRKPKALKFMLEKIKKLENYNFQDAICPKTSNTRGSLIDLAVEFGSKGFYDTIDNECIKIITDTFKDDIKRDPNILVSSLIKSICLSNDDAIKIFTNLNVNYFYPLPEDQDELDDDSGLEMPIMIIFRRYNNQEQLIEIFSNLFTPEQGQSIFDRLMKIKVNGNNISTILGREGFDQSRNFIEERKGNLSSVIHILTQNGSLQNTNPISNDDDNNNNDDDDEVDEDLLTSRH